MSRSAHSPRRPCFSSRWPRAALRETQPIGAVRHCAPPNQRPMRWRPVRFSRRLARAVTGSQSEAGALSVNVFFPPLPQFQPITVFRVAAGSTPHHPWGQALRVQWAPPTGLRVHLATQPPLQPRPPSLRQPMWRVYGSLFLGGFALRDSGTMLLV